MPTFPPLVAKYAEPVEPIWVVEELPRVVRPVTLRVPPIFAVLAKRLVEEAVVAKKLVVVAEVPVAFEKVKFWRVVEPVTKSAPPSSVPPTASKIRLETVGDEVAPLPPSTST